MLRTHKSMCRGFGGIQAIKAKHWLTTTTSLSVASYGQASSLSAATSLERRKPPGMPNERHDCEHIIPRLLAFAIRRPLHSTNKESVWVLCMPSAQPPLRFTNRHSGRAACDLANQTPCAECAHLFS